MNESSTTHVPINTTRSLSPTLPTTLSTIVTTTSTSSPKEVNDLEELLKSKTFLISVGTGGSLFLLSVIICICSYTRYRKHKNLLRSETLSTTAGSLRQSFKQVAVRGLFSFKQEKLKKQKTKTNTHGNIQDEVDAPEDQVQDDFNHQVNAGYNPYEESIDQPTNQNHEAKPQVVYADLTGDSFVGKAIYENSSTISENLYCPLTQDGCYQTNDGHKDYEIVQIKTAAIDINVQTNMMYQE